MLYKKREPISIVQSFDYMSKFKVHAIALHHRALHPSPSPQSARNSIDHGVERLPVRDGVFRFDAGSGDRQAQPQDTRTNAGQPNFSHRSHFPSLLQSQPAPVAGYPGPRCKIFRQPRAAPAATGRWPHIPPRKTGTELIIIYCFIIK